VLAKDGTDSVGFTVADRANGAGQGFIAVRQLQARNQVDLVANGKLTRLDKGFKAANEFRIVIDETGSKPVCEVLVNGWSAGRGAVEVASAERYIFIQVVDNNRNGNALIDDFQLLLLE
jgi:hypothetical protein